jgi:hypothetical protein
MIQIKAPTRARRDTRVMPKHPLTRDVMIVIAIKLMVVAAAALFVFGPGQRPRIDAGSIEMRLIGSPAVSSDIASSNAVNFKSRNIAP